MHFDGTVYPPHMFLTLHTYELQSLPHMCVVSGTSANAVWTAINVVLAHHCNKQDEPWQLPATIHTFLYFIYVVLKCCFKGWIVACMTHWLNMLHHWVQNHMVRHSFLPSPPFTEYTCQTFVYTDYLLPSCISALWAGNINKRHTSQLLS